MREERRELDFIQYDGTEAEWYVGNSDGHSVMMIRKSSYNYRKRWNAKRRNGKTQAWRRDKDKAQCKAAIVQALRYHFGLKVKDIVRLTHYASQTISSLTVSSSTDVIPWHAREHKEEAILAAAKLIEKTRYEGLRP